ncbi:MAG: hypothetical protein H7Y17_04560 [Chlorobia bacterium]|nr:hypothetical protein [Fimbriimonadaceae bacterium]
MHLLLGASLIWLSAGLAVATYLGVRLLAPPNKPTDRAEESVDDINVIASLGQRLPTGELRKQCTEIGVKARTLLSQLQRSGGSVEAEFLIQQYLEQTRKGLELFLGERSRSNLGKTQSLAVLTQLLATVSDRFINLQVSLDSQDDQALAGELKLLTQTLTDLDQFSVTLNQGN